MPQIVSMPHAPFDEGDMTNAELRNALINLTQLMMDQAHVVNNHFVSQPNKWGGPQPHASTPASTIPYLMRIHKVFMDEVFNVVDVMGVSHREKA